MYNFSSPPLSVLNCCAYGGCSVLLPFLLSLELKWLGACSFLHPSHVTFRLRFPSPYSCSGFSGSKLSLPLFIFHCQLYLFVWIYNSAVNVSCWRIRSPLFISSWPYGVYWRVNTLEFSAWRFVRSAALSAFYFPLFHLLSMIICYEMYQHGSATTGVYHHLGLGLCFQHARPVETLDQMLFFSSSFIWQKLASFWCFISSFFLLFSDWR